MRQHSLHRVLQAKLLWPWPKGEYDCCCPLIQPFSTRYLTPPATSTAVERLFSAAGLIMDAKRNKLSPTFVDKLLFLREAHLLGICKLDWKWKTYRRVAFGFDVLKINVPLTVPIRCYHCLKKGPYFRECDLGPYFIKSLVPISNLSGPNLFLYSVFLCLKV